MFSKKLNNISKINSFYFFLRVLIYPIFALYELPSAWIKSIYNSRVLLDGRWDRYMGFQTPEQFK